MKKILPLITLLIGLSYTSKAQTDYCKDIVKTSNETAVFYESPTPSDKKEEMGQFGFFKIIDEKGARTYFKLGLSIEESGNKITDASITFEDNDVINFSNLSIKEGNEIKLLDRHFYLYTTLLPLSPDQLTKLKTKTIAYYNFLGTKRIPRLGNAKVKIMAYANCIEAFTQGPVPVVNANEKKSIDGFWGIKFGASVDEAKATVIAKGGKLNAGSSKPDMLIFDNVVFTERHLDMLRLNFVNGKFYEAGLLFPASEQSEVINKFKTIVNELNNVYGPAVITKKFEPPYDTGTGEYDVQAITFGKGQYFATWKTNNRNMISIQINKELTLSLFYTDTTLQKEKTVQKSADY